MWHKLTQQARQDARLVVVGVIQEQHADRCRLYAQWQEFDWPILHDPLNHMKARAVPMFVAIDEAGVVVDAGLRTNELDAFLDRPPVQAEGSPTSEHKLDSIASLVQRAQESNSGEDWERVADHRLLWGGMEQLGNAIRDYGSAIKSSPTRASAYFSRGVALRARFDSSLARPSDFQDAVNDWSHALQIDPNHYIFRRRIEQYGPRLIKPYPFYDWVSQAQQEIAVRGDEPVSLVAEPSGAEIAQPIRSLVASNDNLESPDVDGRITRDPGRFVSASSIVVPGVIQKGKAVRVHVQLLPNQLAHWNNESGPVQLWINVPDGWQAESPLLQGDLPHEAESHELRQFEFELQSPKQTTVESVSAYVLYYVCEEAGGQCLYRRQDIEIPIRFSNK